MENILQRIKELSENEGIKITALETKIGASKGVLSRAIKNNTDIQSKWISKIVENYPQYDSKWLLTGMGEMIKCNQELNIINGCRKTNDTILDIQEIPFYNLEATAGLQELFDSGKPHEVLETIKIPNLPKCDGALTVTGDSMYPLLKSGDIVLYKQTSVDSIFYGEMYLLSVKIDHWEEYVTVKYVQKSEKGEDYVKLVSQNQHHQSKDIQITNISAIAMVKASVRFNTMF